MVSFEKAYAIVKRKIEGKEVISCIETKNHFVFNMTPTVADSKAYIVHKGLGIYREVYFEKIAREPIIRQIDIRIVERKQN